MPCLGFATLSSRCSHAHPCRRSIMFGLKRLSARFATAGSTIMLVGDAYDCYDLRSPVVVARLQPSTHVLSTLPRYSGVAEICSMLECFAFDYLLSQVQTHSNRTPTSPNDLKESLYTQLSSVLARKGHLGAPALSRSGKYSARTSYFCLVRRRNCNPAP